MDSNVIPALGRFVIPEAVATHFHIRSGDTVADFGAGSGYFVSVLSKAVGADGHVYACEIQKNLVETIGNLVRQQNLSNVETLWCDIEEPGGVKIENNMIDIVLVCNTLFQAEAKDVVMNEAARVLRSGGKLFVIDWSESFQGMGPRADQIITIDDAKALGETAGFIYERSYDAGDHHYGLAFRKP